MHQTSSTSPSVAASDLSLLWRAKLPIFAAALTAGVIGWVAGWLIPATYRSEVELRIGRVLGTPVENPYEVARRINSYGFRTFLFPEESKRFGARTVTAEIVEGSGPEKIPVYVHITAAGASSASAVEHARRVIDHIAAQQKPLHDVALQQHAEYERVLTQQLETAQQEAAALSARLASTQKERGAGTSALLLLESDLNSRHLQIVDLAEKLRDVKIKRQNDTFPTEPLAAPSPATAPIWPRKLLIAAVSAGSAFLLAMLIVVLVPARRPHP